MDDLFDEWGGIDWGGSPNFDLGGLGYDIGAFDLGGIDLGNIDLGGLGYDIGAFDLGGIDLGGIDLGGLGYDTGAFDLGGIGLGGIDLGGLGYDIGAFKDYVGGTEGFANAADEVGGAGYFPGYLVNPDGSITPYGFDKGYYGEGESHGVDENGMEYWIAPDGSVMYSKYVDEKGYERNPDGTPTGRTIEDIVGPGNVTVPSGRTPTGLNTSGIGGSGDKTFIDRLIEKISGGGKEGIATPKSGVDPLLMALLGGLLGLLSKNQAPKLPVGYQGGIPKYTATRVPGQGVQYTRAAQGGLMGLAAGGAARPARYLRGGTDGMADKIQTDIEGKQPARLSHGEFVIPADVVSHLGNGNSDAGADVLYEMMAKVRKARTGTPKQGKQINPRKMIPA